MELNWTTYNPETPARRVLLVGPSLGGNAVHQWTKVAEELINDTRVIFVDLPGSGLGPVWDDTMEPRLDAIADGVALVADEVRAEVGDVPVYFAGLSISGATALHVAHSHPEKFAGVIVVASAATVGEPQRWLERAEKVEADGTAYLTEETTKRWFTPSFRAEQPRVVETIMDGLAAVDDSSYAQLCRALAHHDMRQDLSDISLPVMLIAGSRDSSTPIANVELVAESVQRGQLHVVEDAAHLVPVSHPRKVAELIRAMMERGPSSKVVSESSD